MRGDQVGPASARRQDPTWGLHLLDANVELGDLLTVVRDEAAVFARRARVTVLSNAGGTGIATVTRVSRQRAAADGLEDSAFPRHRSADAGHAEGEGHRERLIAAMAASIVEKGYRETTVADVVRLARTSRRSFYENFEDRDACFLALFDATNDAMMQEIAAAVHPDQTLEEQVDRAMDAYIDNVTDQPALYASFVRELPALGQAGAERGLATLERFAAMLVSLVESGRAVQPDIAARPLTMDTAIIIVGGLRELAVISLQRGRDVRELRTRAGATVKAILAGALL